MICSDIAVASVSGDDSVNEFPRYPGTVMTTFDCECAQADCDATVERTIASFPAISGVQPAVLAHGHILN